MSLINNNIKLNDEIISEFSLKPGKKLLGRLIIVDMGVIIIVIPLSIFLVESTLHPIKELISKEDKFVADAAHELRTPLAIIKTGIQSTQKNIPEEIKEYENLNADILEETERLINITNDLLLLSKNQFDDNKNNFKKLNISQIVEKLIKWMKSYAIESNIKFKSKIEKNLILTGSEEDITRLILNIYKNAVDYNKVNGEVFLELHKFKNKIELKIKDTGIGIPKTKLIKVFDRFYKENLPTNTNNIGSGLGLSIAKEIIDKHKGEISIESVKNKGTTVFIRFKL